ncbi:hypothetical protein CF139_04895 [Aeromonas hydrophila]|uniref:DUF3283 family protein n=1 Tax=Aeromonas hydrophila TaxID=644 RepID=UPI0011164CE3|nr:DUF3283 family protein [Aeromonas hydrophila]TNH91121.1 hypothetical protein CF139_04895 [Aeromonas hydrophila]
MAFNLARLPEQDRQRVELDKQAAFLVWSCRHGRTTREDVAKAVIQQPAEYQEYFRERLNHYREVKGSHEQVY